MASKLLRTYIEKSATPGQSTAEIAHEVASLDRIGKYSADLVSNYNSRPSHQQINEYAVEDLLESGVTLLRSCYGYHKEALGLEEKAIAALLHINYLAQNGASEAEIALDRERTNLSLENKQFAALEAERLKLVESKNHLEAALSLVSDQAIGGRKHQAGEIELRRLWQDKRDGSAEQYSFDKGGRRYHVFPEMRSLVQERVGEELKGQQKSLKSQIASLDAQISRVEKAKEAAQMNKALATASVAARSSIAQRHSDYLRDLDGYYSDGGPLDFRQQRALVLSLYDEAYPLAIELLKTCTAGMRKVYPPAQFPTIYQRDASQIKDGDLFGWINWAVFVLHEIGKANAFSYSLTRGFSVRGNVSATDWKSFEQYGKCDVTIDRGQFPNARAIRFTGVLLEAKTGREDLRWRIRLTPPLQNRQPVQAFDVANVSEFDNSKATTISPVPCVNIDPVGIWQLEVVEETHRADWPDRTPQWQRSIKDLLLNFQIKVVP